MAFSVCLVVSRTFCSTCFFSFFVAYEFRCILTITASGYLICQSLALQCYEDTRARARLCTFCLIGLGVEGFGFTFFRNISLHWWSNQILHHEFRWLSVLYRWLLSLDDLFGNTRITCIFPINTIDGAC